MANLLVTPGDAGAVLKAELADLASPLLAIGSPQDARLFLASLGWNASGLPGFDLAQVASELAAAAPEVVAALASTDRSLPALARAAVALARPLAGTVDRIRAWQSQAPITPAQVGILVDDIAHSLLDAYLCRRQPLLRAVLNLAGILTVTDHPAITVGTSTVRRPQPRPRFDFAALGAALSDPLGYLRKQLTSPSIGRRTAEALSDIVGPLLMELLSELEIPVSYGPPGLERSNLTPERRSAAQRLLVIDWMLPLELEGQPLATRYRAAFGLVDDTGGKGLGLVVATTGPASIGFARPELAASMAVEGLPKAVLVTGAGLTMPAGTSAAPALTIEVTLPGSGPGPAFRIGDPAGTCLSVDHIAAALRFDTAGGPDVAGRIALNGIRLRLAGSDGDGFLAKVLPPGDAGSGDIELRCSLRRGLEVAGGGELEWPLKSVPPLGPLELRSVRLRLRIGTEGVSFTVGALVVVQLGPVRLSAEDVGVRFALTGSTPGTAPASPVPAARLELGPARIEAGFQPPAGIAVSIDAPPIRGGGYLFGDPAAGQYAGAVQLQLGAVSLSAVGVLSTKLPGGAAGYSLVVLVSTHFAPVQLGFGFSLTGVGGLVAINRTVSLPELRGNLQAGTLAATLFPADVMSNPTKVVADLQRCFPAAPGQYVVGPTVDVTWGEAGVLTAQIGLFVEFPNPTRVLLVGTARLALPTSRAPVTEINLDLLGSLDLSAKELALDAALRNSRIAGFTLSGEAALRASWGDSPGFLLAIGGFHPRFTPPSSFPALRRVSLALSDGANPRLRMEAYLALTSNTVQVGGRLDLYAALDIAGAGTFAVAALIGFDALFQLDPFAFVVDIHASVALLWNNAPFLAIRLDLALSGPTPWRAVGQATFNCLGSHTIHFQVTVGQAAAITPPPAVSAIDVLVGELAKAASWKAQLPGANRALVVMGAAAGGTSTPGAPVVHPLGSLTVRQSQVPLDLEISRIGSARVEGERVLSITASTLGSSTVRTPVYDQFAPAQYLDLSDDEKLSWPSFQPLVSGATLGAPGHTLPGSTRTVAQRFENHLLAPSPAAGWTSSKLPDAPLADDRLRRQVVRSAVAEEGATSRGAEAYAHVRQATAVLEPTYAVAEARSLTPTHDPSGEGTLTSLPSYAVAEERRRALRRPDLAVVETLDCYPPPAPPPLVQLDPTASYTLTAVHSGKCLEAAADPATQGRKVWQATCRPQGNQYWRFVSRPDGTYTVISLPSGLALTATGGGANGSAVELASSLDALTQRWRPVEVSTGRYRLEVAAQGRCLDVFGGPGAVEDGTPVIVWDWHGGTNQLWTLTVVREGASLRQQIRERAFVRWQQRGRPLWRALEDWLAAERELLDPLIRRHAYGLYEQRGRQPGRALDDWLAAERDLKARVINS